MKKMLAIAMAVAFSMGAAGMSYAQDKKMEEKKADAKMEKSDAKMDKSDAKADKKAAKKADKKAANPCAAKADAAKAEKK